MNHSYDEEGHALESFSTEAKANIRARQQRMRALLKHITENGKHLPKTKLIALFCVREGISKATTYSYLEEYLEADIVAMYDDHLLPWDQYTQLMEADNKRLKELAGRGD